VVENGIGFLVKDVPRERDQHPEGIFQSLMYIEIYAKLYVQTRFEIFKNESQRLGMEICKRVDAPDLTEAFQRLFDLNDASAIGDLERMAYIKLDTTGTRLVI